MDYLMIQGGMEKNLRTRSAAERCMPKRLRPATAEALDGEVVGRLFRREMAQKPLAAGSL